MTEREERPEENETGAAEEASPDGADGASGEDEDDGSGAEAISEEILEELKELEELRDRHLRLAAEFDNYRRRTRRELLQMREIAQADLAAQLLEVLDDLRRVSETPTETTTVEALEEGIDLVERKFSKVLRDAGMEAIDPTGQPFDPNLHEALLRTPTDDPEKDELVDQVLLTGYRFGDRLLRPARVSVLKYDEDAEDA